MQRILIIIPTLNEEGNIPELAGDLRHQSPVWNILFVDGQSTDDTVGIIKSLQKSDPHIHLLRQPHGTGYAEAFREGFRFARQHHFEQVVTMDGDLSHSPAAVSSLLHALQTADLVIGSRYLEMRAAVSEWPFQRLILSRVASLCARLSLSLRLTDPFSGFKAIRGSMLKKIHLERSRTHGFAFNAEISWRVHRGGGKIREVPIHFRNRQDGKSKMSPRKILEAASLPFRLRLERK